MIYVDNDFLKRFIKEDELKSDPPETFFQERPILDFSDDDDDPDSDDEDYEMDYEKLIPEFIDRILPVIFDFYPHLRSKRKKLEETLLENAEYFFESISEMNDSLVEGKYELDVYDDGEPDEISINGILSFPRNKKLDHLLENYEEWIKLKTSFENIYVESFYAGVFVKRIHSLLISMIFEYCPIMKSLPAEKLDKTYAYVSFDAWDIYDGIVRADPDELNDSKILRDLEDYEYEDLMYFPGPQILRDAHGNIKQICIPRNKPKPEKVPPCCRQCRYFNDAKLETTLCSVTRFSQRNSEVFNCRAYEEYDPNNTENNL